MPNPQDYRVIVIGGGGTGAAIAYDLAKRGFHTSLFERGEFTSGTTGRHHGQLHSGARYAVGDRDIARECMEETTILRRIASQSLEDNYGLFVATNDEDQSHHDEFVEACHESGIPTREIPVGEALEMEPLLNPEIRSAVLVPDGTIDAFRLPMQFLASAQRLGAGCHNFTPVIGVETSEGAITGVHVRDLRTGTERFHRAELVINAAGAWGEQVAGFSKIDLPLTPAPGTMVSVAKRLNNMVISRLHPVGDGDIIVPQRNLSTIGSTQWITDDPDDISIPQEDIDYLMDAARALIPSFADHPIRAAWTATRPLAGSSESGGRELSRDFACINHGTEDGIQGFFSVTGGKATVLRAMAEKTVDALCEELGFDRACTTADEPLDSYMSFYRARVPVAGTES